jgi:hypothetical protein
MIDVLNDGIGHWVILRNDWLLGHIHFSSRRCMFRAVTPRGQLTHHATFTAALDAIKDA